jgi:hypothetical protein
MIRGRFWPLFVVFAFAAEGCGDKAQTPCPPVDVTHVLTAQRAAEVDLAQVPEPQSVRFYIDGSGSMAGFASANAQNATPFGDVIRSVGLWSNKENVEIHRLNDDRPSLIGNANAARLAAMLTPAFYVCSGPEVGPNCSFRHSRTQHALNSIADAPEGTLSVFVSDLWFSDDEVRFSPGIDIRDAFARILRNNDVLLYGFKAPYAGRLGDLPSGDRQIRPGRLPFYMLVVGSREQVRAFHQRFLATGSRWILDRIPSGGARRVSDELHFTLFSRTGSFEQAPILRFAPGDSHRGIMEALPWREQRDAVPRQFTVDSGRLSGPSSRLHWDPGEPALAYAAWRGNFDVQATAWQVTGSRCGAGRTLQSANGGTDPRITLEPARLRSQLGLGRWLIVGSIRRTRLDPNQPAVRWAHAWSFSSDATGETGARRTLSESGFFPTMNLADFVRLLEQAVDEAGSRREPSQAGEPFAGFATLIEIK